MKQKLHNQTGQTLIETLVASIVLVMGISAAVGLSVYALGATSGVNKQLIASGLAREGIEAVKNMRDTNWLQSGPDTNCYDFYTGNPVALCHSNWLNVNGGGYDIDPGNSSQTYALGVNLASGNNHWRLIRTNNRFGLDTGTPSAIGGLYDPGAGGTFVNNSNTKFGRMITLSKDTFQPFDKSDLGPRLKVRVDVWWTDKRCPVSNTLPTNDNCTFTLETYLTNWKNY